MTDHDFEIMAKTIYGEARGESRQGQTAVACVIFNRLRSKKWFSAKTAAGVCLKPLQFSCWNKSDPNSRILANLPYSAYSKYFDVIKEAEKADITNGATHYCTREVLSRTKWASGKEPCFECGNHLFFRDID